MLEALRPLVVFATDRANFEKAEHVRDTHTLCCVGGGVLLLET